MAWIGYTASLMEHLFFQDVYFRIVDDGIDIGTLSVQKELINLTYMLTFVSNVCLKPYLTQLGIFYSSIAI